MTTPFPYEYTPLADGQPVAASTFNDPLNILKQRTVSLDELVKNSLIGRAIMQPSAPLQGDNVKLGMAVYRDSTGVFKPGLASLVPYGSPSTLGMADSCFVWGVVQQKYTSTLGNIVTCGSMQLSSVDLHAIMPIGANDPIPTGVVYLSATANQAGYLTTVKPAFGIAIGDLQGPDGVNEDGDDLYTLFVNIGWRSPSEQHIHYGTQLSVADKGAWVTTSADSPAWISQATWDVANPTKLAPPNAKYRYNIEKDTNLAPIWPAIPIGAVAYDVTGVAADLVGNAQVLINSNGIWWMSNTDPLTVRHDLYFTRMTFKTATNMVTSLTAADASVTITDADGNPASVGDLKIGAGFDITALGTDNITGIAVKSNTATQLGYGPVIEGIRSLSGNITVTGAGSFTDSGHTYQKGLMTINFTSPSSRDGLINFDELDGVRVETINGVNYLTFKAGVAASVRSRISLPAANVPVDSTLTFKFTVSGTAAGTMPTLAMTYLIIPAAAALNTLYTLDTSYTAFGTGLALGAFGVIPSSPVKYGQAMVALPDTVNPGDTVYITMARTNSDGYSGDIRIIDQRWSVG